MHVGLPEYTHVLKGARSLSLSLHVCINRVAHFGQCGEEKKQKKTKRSWIKERKKKNIRLPLLSRVFRRYIRPPLLSRVFRRLRTSLVDLYIKIFRRSTPPHIVDIFIKQLCCCIHLPGYMGVLHVLVFCGKALLVRVAASTTHTFTSSMA